MNKEIIDYKSYVYKVDDLTVDLRARTVFRENKRILLPELTFDLLEELMVTSPNAVSKDAMLKGIWKSDCVSDETIVQRVALLRKALGDVPKTPKYIRTVRGVGYSLLAPVEHINVEQLDGRHPNQSGKTKRYTPTFYTVVITAILFLLGIYSSINMLDIEQGLTNQAASSSHQDKVNEQARQLLSVWEAAKTDQAITMLHSIVEETPQHLPSKLTLSFALSTKATKFEGPTAYAIRAEELARELIQVSEIDGMYWHALGYALDAQNRIDEALAAFQNAYNLNPLDSTAKSSAANLMLIRGRIFDALEIEFEALNNQSSSIFAELQIAKCLDLLGLPEAEGWWGRALTLPLGRQQIINQRVINLLSKKRYDEAKALIDNAAREFNNSDYISSMYGIYWLHRGEHEQAKYYFNDVESGSKRELALVKALEGDKVLASDFIEQLKTQHHSGHSSPYSRIQLAKLYASTGNKSLAHTSIIEAVDLGWRDIDYMISNPVFNEIISSSKFQSIKMRIENELAIQRQLVKQQKLPI